jgi:hypothetical protein
MQGGHFSSTHYLIGWLWWNINVLSNILYERSFEVRNNIVTESANEVCWNTVNNSKFISSLAESTRLLCYFWTPITQMWGVHEVYWGNTWVTTKNFCCYWRCTLLCDMFRPSWPSSGNIRNALEEIMNCKYYKQKWDPILKSNILNVYGYVTEINLVPGNAYSKLRKQDVAFELPTMVSDSTWIDPRSFPWNLLFRKYLFYF